MKVDNKSLSTNRINNQKSELYQQNHQQTITKTDTNKKIPKKQHHLRLSNTPNILSKLKHNKQNQNIQNYKYHSTTSNPSTSNKINQSPYANLPSLQSESKQILIKSPYLQSRCEKQNHYQSSQPSIYHQFGMGTNPRNKGFQTQSSSEQQNCIFQNGINQDYNININRITKRNDTERRKQKCSHSKNNRNLNNIIKSTEQNQNQYNFIKSKSNYKPQQIVQYVSSQSNHLKNSSVNFSNKQQCQNEQRKQLLKRQISQKLDRVCQRIQNLSKSKQKSSNKQSLTMRKCSFHSQNNFREHDINKENYSIGDNRYSKNHYNKDCNNHNGYNNEYLNGIGVNSNNIGRSPKCQYGKFYSIQKQRMAIPGQYNKANYNHNVAHINQSSSYSQYSNIHSPFNQNQQDYDNFIQHKILPLSDKNPLNNQPYHRQFLQANIIQLDRKLKNANIRIIALQEQLLGEKEMLVKKEKIWLRRENELLKQLENQLLNVDQLNFVQQVQNRNLYNESVQKVSKKSQVKNNMAGSRKSIRTQKSANTNYKSNTKIQKSAAKDQTKTCNNIIIMDSSNLNPLQFSQIQNYKHLYQQNQKKLKSIQESNSKQINTISMLNEKILKQQEQLVAKQILYQSFLTKTLNIANLNINWTNLMNRTLSEQLPGTAFRVKQQMNLNKNVVQQIKQICQSVKFRSGTHSPQSQPLLLQNSPSIPISHYNDLKNNQDDKNDNNQSEVFLLQSYCPQSSKFQILDTKRNDSSRKNKLILSLSKVKKSSRKSLTPSECKSTNKKFCNAKSNQKKQLQKQNKYNTSRQSPSPLSRKISSLQSSCYINMKESYCCQQVFYGSTQSHNLQQSKDNKMQQNSHFASNLIINNCLNLSESKFIDDRNQFLLLQKQKLINQPSVDDHYFMLQLQALTIEKFLTQFNNNTQNKIIRTKDNFSY